MRSMTAISDDLTFAVWCGIFIVRIAALELAGGWERDKVPYSSHGIFTHTRSITRGPER